MKTNQMIQVAFGNDLIEIGHKDLVGSLTDLLRVGNKYRMEDNLKPFTIQSLLKTEEFNAFVNTVAKEQNKNVSELVYVKGRGRGSSTYANLHIMIYVAQRLNARFHYHIIDTFINQNILKLRDDGGNDFNRLNVLIDTLSDRTKTLKPKGNRGCYIQVAKLIRGKIFYTRDIERYGNNSNIWNSKIANSSHQLKRGEYESKLCTLIDMGFVSTYSELINAIDKL